MRIFSKNKLVGLYFTIPKRLKRDLDIFLAEEGLTLKGFLEKVVKERKEVWDYINESSEKFHI